MLNNMGYFASLDIQIDVEKDKLVEFIIEDIWKKQVVRPYGKLEEQGEGGIVFEAMTIFLDRSDDDDLEYFIEQYGMSLNYSFYIELYQKVQDRYYEVMSFLIKMVEKYFGDCVFSLNGTTLLLRKQGNIVIDKVQMKKYNELPYQKLPGNYIEDNIDEE